MEALSSAYDSSDGEESGEGSVDIDPTKTSEVVAKLKQKFPLNSAPHVPIRVSTN